MEQIPEAWGLPCDLSGRKRAVPWPRYGGGHRYGVFSLSIDCAGEEQSLCPAFSKPKRRLAVFLIAVEVFFLFH